MSNKLPTVFHVTHQKAGSQWASHIIKALIPSRWVQVRENLAHFYEDPIKIGGFYPTVYVPVDEFEGMVFAKNVSFSHFPASKFKRTFARAVNWINFSHLRNQIKVFVIVRDLRDTLISQYYSFLYSHSSNDVVMQYRGKLRELNFEDGILFLMENRLPLLAKIQRSWALECYKGNALLVKFEYLIEDEIQTFRKILDYIEVEYKEEKLKTVLADNSFEVLSGRTPGEEDIFSHYRKGVMGDWKNHFSDRLNIEFNKRFGSDLILLGYEANID